MRHLLATPVQCGHTLLADTRGPHRGYSAKGEAKLKRASCAAPLGRVITHWKPIWRTNCIPRTVRPCGATTHTKT